MRKKLLLKNYEIVLFLIYFSSLVLSALGYYNNIHIALPAFFLYGISQIINIFIQINRRNFLTSVWGTTLTIMLLLALFIEISQNKSFGGYLTRAVYTQSNIITAFNILLFASSLFHAITIFLVPKGNWQWEKSEIHELKFARKYTVIFLLFGIIITIITVSGDTVFNAPYASDKARLGKGLIESSGLSLVGIYLLSFSLVSAVRQKGYKSFYFKIILVAVLIFTIYFRLFRGDRGGILGIFATIFLIFIFCSNKSKVHKVAIITFCLFCLLGFFQVWGYMRANIYRYGYTQSFIDGINYSIVDPHSKGFDPLKITLLPQSYWHLLHVIDLYKHGISLNGSSFIDIIPQSIPKFITDAFGYTRPLNGAWRLAEYRIHGGGMFVVALGYWNLGLIGVTIIVSVLAFIAILLENWYRNQTPLIACAYFALLGSFGFGIFYGWQPLFKSIEISLLLAILLKFLLKKYERRYNSLLKRSYTFNKRFVTR